MKRALPLLGCALVLTACRDAAGTGGTRDHIRVVGSSTVFPFTAIVAERFVAAEPGVASPVIESTGTGAGIRLFCGGVGAAFPDIADASRAMTERDRAMCAANGVRDVLEIPIGLDGIVLAQARGGPPLRLRGADLYRALAAAPFGHANAARTWRDVNPALPDLPIRVHGPPATSGTRDAVVRLILAPACRAIDPAAPLSRCTAIREDGAYMDAGENDGMIVRKLRSDARTIGIFGYSYLERNRDRLVALPLDGVVPDRETIANGTYPGARTLYLYVKSAHLRTVPGLRAFVRLYAASWNLGGPLVARGRIAAPRETREQAARVVARETSDPAAPR